MLLVLRTLLVLGLATLLHTTRKSQAVQVRLAQGTGPKGKTVRLVMDPSVQHPISSMSSSTIASMSLSPWTYRDSYLKSRLPPRISHAECLTSGCQALQGGGDDAALEAKPIYYQILVLHRVKPSKSHKNKRGMNARQMYDFRLGTEVITVGCTCVRPSVVLQQ